jgi:hypothetical protein
MACGQRNNLLAQRQVGRVGAKYQPVDLLHTETVKRGVNLL